MLDQWQFIAVRRLVEKGRYYHECNQLVDNDSEVAECVVGTQDNPKVPVHNPAWQQPERAAWQCWFQSTIACIPHHRWKSVLKTEEWDWGDWRGVNT